MKVVKFKDGTFGARKWSILGYEYVDLNNPLLYSWGRRCQHFPSCRGTKEEAIKGLEMATDKGTVVKN